MMHTKCFDHFLGAMGAPHGPLRRVRYGMADAEVLMEEAGLGAEVQLLVDSGDATGVLHGLRRLV